MNKVLILDLTPFYGGGQKFISNLYKYSQMQDKYHFALSDKKVFDELYTDNKIIIDFVGFRAVIDRINKYIDDNNIQTVILNGNRPIYYAPFITAKYKIAYKHTSNNAFSGFKKYIGPVLLNGCLAFCDKTVILYKAALNELWQTKKAVVINNGIHIKHAADRKIFSNRQEIIFTCISRLDADKGISWLIDVFNETFGSANNVILKIAGDGELMAFLQTKIEQLKVNVKVLGFVNNIEDLLIGSDVLVLPSKFESFPLSILEAMNYSLPVIATNTGGITEMVNDKNGFLINYGDSDALKHAMHTLVKNKDIRDEMGNYSKEFLKSFSIEECVRKIEELIK